MQNSDSIVKNNIIDEIIQILNEMNDGLFICIEGIDGVGKSTQAKILEASLKASPKFNLKKEIWNTSEPFDNKVGKMIREMLKENSSDIYSDALLFTVNRMQHITEISKQLKQSKIVICDRYVDSTLNYQEVDYFMPKTPPLIINPFRRWLLHLQLYTLTPNIVFILDNDVDQCLMNLKRTNKVTERFEYKEFLENLRKTYKNHKGFAELYSLKNEFYVKSRCITDYKTIDCSNKSIDDIHFEILNYIDYYLKKQ